MSIITVPFAWLLMRLYDLFQNYGLAIILFTLIVKVIFIPTTLKSKKNALQMSRIEPRRKEIEKKYAGNQAKIAEETQKLYKAENVKPLSGCLWSLISFPILIALYAVVRQPLTHLMSLSAEEIDGVRGVLENLVTLTRQGSYSGEIELAQQGFHFFDQVKAAVPAFLRLDFSFLNINLGDVANWQVWNWDMSQWSTELVLFSLPVISAALSILSAKVNQKTMSASQQSSMKSMMIMSPIISLYIGFTMPTALSLYWIFNSVFSIILDMWANRHYTAILDREEAVRTEAANLRAAELAAKQEETERLRQLNATKVNPNTSKKKLQQSEKRRLESRAAEANQDKKHVEDEPSREGTRKFARGRAYLPSRYAEDEVDFDEEDFDVEESVEEDDVDYEYEEYEDQEDEKLD